MNLDFARNYRSGTLVSGLKDVPFVRIAVIVLFLLSYVDAAESQDSQMVYEGFTEPHFDIMVAATEIGRLQEVLVEVGDHVQQGQTLAVLEDSLQETALKIAKLQAEMHGDLDAAKAEALLQRARRDQIRELAADAMARPNELMRAEADLKIAEARQVAAVEQQELRKLELDRYRLQWERRRVTAPMSGIISKVFHQPGEYITPGDPAVLRLLVIDQIFAVFNVPAEDVRAMKIGSRVEVHLRSTSKSVSGQIHSIAPDIDGESGTVQIKVALNNQGGQLRVGDRCTMQLGARNKVAQRSVITTQPSSEAR